MASVGHVTTQIDFARHRFRFLPSLILPPPSWGVAVPLADADVALRTVTIRHGDTVWQAIVDTGCTSDGGVRTELFNSLTDAPPLPGGRTWTAFGLSPSDVRVKWLGGVALPGTAGEYWSVALQDRAADDNVIGVSLLSRNALVTFDPADRMMYVRQR